tara:strand:- start:1226 stop:2014 length:789 start_codon:yes stop_codon:yes gene_type:complete
MTLNSNIDEISIRLEKMTCNDVEKEDKCVEVDGVDGVAGVAQVFSKLNCDAEEEKRMRKEQKEDAKDVIDIPDYNKELNSKLDKKETLEKIKSELPEYFDKNIISSLKTQNGFTQKSERIYISEIIKVFDILGFTYDQASSQQSKDFRNINNTGLNLEVKKTDKFNVMCNDTCPSNDIEYLIIFTGKTYKNNQNKNIKPQLIFINGSKLIEGCDWLPEFQNDIKYILDKYCRGENKKNLSGLLRVYARPTYQFNIKNLLNYD